MARTPVAGRVKTRLAREAGVGAATRLARSTTTALLARVTRDAPWSTTLAVTPDTAVASGVWPRGVMRIPQGPGDLGTRMQRIMTAMPPGPVLIIGTDVPRITPTLIRMAFRRLGSGDAVFGPATDGGYWLVGLRRRPRVLRLFSRVRWSTEHALADTLRNAAHGRIAMVDTLSDIDSSHDLELSSTVVGRVVLPRASRPPPV